jgi:hypothetical protein
MAQTAEHNRSADLPPELWQRIFLQHTDPNELWTLGRQVCSAWRSGIPNVFAKKYLENPDMVQIYFDLGRAKIEGTKCFMGAEMVFDRYEGKADKRCVFVEHTSTGNSAKNDPDEEYRRKYQRVKYGTWRKGLETYLGVDPEARRTGGRFDLPPYQIRIKSRASDTELPGLDFDVDKREISFEWEGMFVRFFYELRVLESVQHSIMAESTLWLSERVRTLGDALSHNNKRWQALRNATKRIRRHQIRSW